MTRMRSSRLMAAFVRFIFAPRGNGRTWRSRNPAHGLDGAPAAFYGALNRFLSRGRDSLAMVGLKFQVSTIGPCRYFAFRAHSGAVGALATHIGDILGCGEGGDLRVAPRYLERQSGDLEV